MHSHRRTTQLLIPIAAMAMLPIALQSGRAEEPAGAKATESQKIIDLLTKIDQRLANQQTQSELILDMMRKDLKDLREDVVKLQRDVADLRRTNTGVSTSNYPSQMPQGPIPNTTALAPTWSTVRLVNTFATDMTAMVNGVWYVVPPGQQRFVSVPSGTMTFQVLQVPAWGLQARTLSPNETFTLTLKPM